MEQINAFAIRRPSGEHMANPGVDLFVQVTVELKKVSFRSNSEELNKVSFFE